jgi:AcrR family transcriptional regulator
MTANAQRDTKPAAIVRGSHAERTAAMRQRLIEAAITCLRRVGYAATTTQLVMDEAGVSRGAMLHHFPAKVDLMIAVGEYAAAFQNHYVEQWLKTYPAGMDRFLGITDATWEAMNQTPALALIEIMIASRSDPALSERFPAVAQRLEAAQVEGVWQTAHDLGIQDRDAVIRMARLHMAAMRGLAIEAMFTGKRMPADDSMALLGWYKRQFTGALLTRGSEPLLPPRTTEA